MKTGPSTSRQQDKRIEFISLKKTIKMAQSLGTLVLLAVVHTITDQDMPKNTKKSKSKTRAIVAHGLTKGKKCQIWKESSLAKDATTIKDKMKEMVEIWIVQ